MMHSWHLWTVTVLLVPAGWSRPVAQPAPAPAPNPNPNPQPRGSSSRGNSPRHRGIPPYEECISMWDLMVSVEDFGNDGDNRWPYWTRLWGSPSNYPSTQSPPESDIKMETGGDMTTDIDSKTDIGNNNNNNNNGDNPSDDTLKEEDSTADDTTKGSSSSTLGTFEREIRWRKREEECYQEAVSLELPPQRRYLTEEQAREAGIFNRDYWDKGGSSSSSSAFYTSPREIKEDITTRESESESNSDSKTKPLSMSKSRSKLIMTSSSTDPRRVASAPEETVWDPSRLIITPVSNALRDVEIPKVEKEHVWQLLGNAATALIASKGGASRGGMSSPVMRWRPVVLG